MYRSVCVLSSHIVHKVLTVVNVKHEERLVFSQRIDDIQLELTSCLADLALVPHIILVCSGSGRIGAKVDIQIVNNIGKEFEICDRKVNVEGAQFL
jgi:hypothetical protein